MRYKIKSGDDDEDSDDYDDQEEDDSWQDEVKLWVKRKKQKKHNKK